MKAKTHHIVTWKAREHRSDPAQLEAARDLAKRLGHLRRDLWRKYGSLQAWHRDLQKKGETLEAEIKTVFPPAKYGIAYKPWYKTVEAVIDDIHMVQEAAKTAVCKKISQRYGKDTLRYRALDTLAWMQDPVLHRWMRKAFVRGHTRVENQIALCVGHGAKVERKNKYTIVTVTGFPIEGRANRYTPIVLQFKTGRVHPKGELTLLFKADGLWLHYAHKVAYKQRANNDLIGVDKGYTEALFGSDGIAYGDGIGAIMTKATDAMNRRGKARNRLFQLSKKNPAIAVNNLGRKSMDEFTRKKRAALSNKIREGVNQIFKNYGRVACEDLSQHIPTKHKMKKVNRKLGNWCKGEIHAALEQAATRTSSDLHIVSACYTSQIDFRTKTLLGRRDGDRFYDHRGDVYQSDENAACNIKDRASDKEITRYMKAETVRSILIGRTAKFLDGMGETLESAAAKGWLDPKFLSERKTGKGSSTRRTRSVVVAFPDTRRPQTNQSQNVFHSDEMYQSVTVCHG